MSNTRAKRVVKSTPCDNMAAFDALPAKLREALREAHADYACEPVLSALRAGVPVEALCRHLRRRDGA